MSPVDWVPAPVLAEHIAKPAPELLSHYTNQGGLIGILQNHVLWASNIRFLNDHNEYEFGITLFRDFITNAVAAERDDERKRFSQSMLTAMGQLWPNASVYVASWSDTDDDLGQWRAYSGGGTGFQIRMPGATLRDLAERQNYIFAACIYDPDEQ